MHYTGSLLHAYTTGAVGLDEEQKKGAVKAVAKKEMQERREMREREKEEWHSKKKLERENIRAKYQIPKETRVTRNHTFSNKKCTIC